MQEEQPWLLVQHMAVDRSDVDPIRPQCLITGLTSSLARTKSSAMAALPPPVGWKLMPMARPNGATGFNGIPLSVIGSRRGTLN
jgi:hypothetical protein